jgi:hypothetical protein
MTLPRVKNPKSIKEQRAEVLVMLKSNEILYFMVHNICLYGEPNKKYIIDLVRKQINKQVKTNKMLLKFGQPIDPVWLEPTDNQWGIARKVSDLFMVTKHTSGLVNPRESKIGRPVRDYTNQEIGALNVLEKTGYVDMSSAMSSALWLCQCDCGTEVIRSAHQLLRGLPYCGNKDDCEEGYAIAKEWRKNEKRPREAWQTPEPTKQDADKAARQLMNILENKLIH